MFDYSVKQRPYKKTRLTLNSGKEIIGRMITADPITILIEDCIITDSNRTYKVNSTYIFKDSVKSMEVL